MDVDKEIVENTEEGSGSQSKTASDGERPANESEGTFDNSDLKCKHDHLNPLMARDFKRLKRVRGIFRCYQLKVESCLS